MKTQQKIIQERAKYPRMLVKIDELWIEVKNELNNM